MRGLVLAAGLGTRLGPLTVTETKGMIRVAGVPLIERSVGALEAAGVDQITVVLGHGGDSLRRFLERRFPGVGFSFVVNSRFASTNNIYSLWLARADLLLDDTLVLESDVIFEPDLIRQMVEHPEPNLAVIAPYAPWMDGTVVDLDEDQRIVAIQPQRRPGSGRRFKTVNLYKFSRSYSERAYVPHLESRIREHGHDEFFEAVLVSVLDSGVPGLAGLIFDGRWFEIDDADDLENAEALFAEPEQRFERMQRRHGGYWRLPTVLDFCYLVNPFFPNAELMDELREGFGDAVRSYPSARATIDGLAARAFDVEPGQVVVGNGASELIRLVLEGLDGRLGVPCPTFQEYLHDPATRDVRQLVPPGPDFSYTTEDLLEFVDSQELRVLVLVNPDNPTGHCLEPGQVLRLADRIADRCRLLLDESFVDFSEHGSLLSSEILGRHPNLLVVRSLGKTYGVPGLRLGLLASADEELVGHVRRNLPIWNINAMAEMFLQALPRTRQDYLDACRETRRERQRIARRLDRVPGLRTIPSQANFVLCEVDGEIDGAVGRVRTATELAQALLARYDLLIKDCTGKVGMEGGQFVRLAVRSPEDDDRLLAALHDLLGPAPPSVAVQGVEGVEGAEGEEGTQGAQGDQSAAIGGPMERTSA